MDLTINLNLDPSTAVAFAAALVALAVARFLAWGVRR